MATINPVKLRQDAEKAERSGKFEQAIVAYTKLAEDNRADWSLTNKIGDLHARLGNTREAAVCFGRVAEHLSTEGFHLKAIAIWKKINKLDPSVIEPYLQLGALYVKQGLVVEAKSHYLFVVDEQVKKKRLREAMDVLRRLVAIDPVDARIRGRLATLLRSEGRDGDAAEEYAGLASELRARGRVADAATILDRVVEEGLANPRLKLLLGQIRMDLGETEVAARILDEAQQTSSDDAEVLRSLAEGYLRLDRTTEAEEALRKLVLLQPDDLDIRSQLARVLAIRGRPEEAFEEASPVVDRLLEQRSGAQAATLLESLVAKAPFHVPSLARLTEIYRQIHKDSEATSAYVRLANAYEEMAQDEKAIEVLEVLVGREPGKREHQQRLTELRKKAGHPEEQPGDREFAASLLLPTDDEIKAPLEARPAIRQTRGLTETDKEFIDEHLSEGRVFRKYGLLAKAMGQLTQIIARFPDNVLARVEMRDILLQQENTAGAAEQSLALAEISRMTGDHAAAAAHEADGRGASALYVAATEVVVAEPTDIVIETSDEAVLVEEDAPLTLTMDEVPAVDSVVEDDMEIEFPEAPVTAVETDHVPEPLESLEALEGHPTAPAPVTVEDDLGLLFGPRASPGDVADPEQEVSAQIGEAGLAEMFREFRKGVDEQLGAEDHDTRYNLGIAYKEMGLLDEAIAEFMLAAEDPRRALECMSMLGLCFMEKTLPSEAASWFEKGLAVPGRTSEEYRGLRYDLAVAYEAGGDKKRALEQFSRIAGRGAFRDVAARLRKLRAEVS